MDSIKHIYPSNNKFIMGKMVTINIHSSIETKF